MLKPNTNLVKPIGQLDNIDAVRVRELLKCMKSPIYFAKNYVKIQDPVLGQIPFNTYPFQDEMIAAFQNNQYSINLLSRQQGKALSLDTVIPTPTGWTTIGDIKVNDIIYGADGIQTQVKFVTETMYARKCYNVEFDNGEIIVADAEHLWTVAYTKKSPFTTTTEELITILDNCKKRKIGLYIEIAKPLECEEIDLPIKPYTLGLWLGDGNSNDARFYAHKSDIDELCEYLSQDGYRPGIRKFDPRNNCAFQTIHGISSILRKNNILGNKHIPEIYLRSSVHQRLELLKGLMDTDGYAEKTGYCEFYQKSKKFIEQVAELVSSLGMKPRIRSKMTNGQRYWKVKFASTNHIVFKLGRKIERQQQCKGHPKNNRHYFVNITPVESVPVKCIQVDNQNHLFLCGKSMIPTHNTTVSATYLLWRALYMPDQTLLIAANKLTSALEIMHRIRYTYEELPSWLKVAATTYNKSNIDFENGSRIIARATTADTGRGMSISCLYLDEFSFVRPSIAEEFWTAIQPTLAKGGSCIITSTPNTEDDQFALIYKAAINKNEGEELGENGFKALKFTWRDNPSYDEEWAERQRKAVGEEKFRREFDCEFGVIEDSLITSQVLATLKPAEPSEVNTDIMGVKWFKPIDPNKTFIVSLDPSTGTGKDFSVIQAFQMPEMEQVAEWRRNKVDIRHQINTLQHILKQIEKIMVMSGRNRDFLDIYWSVENNGIGEGAIVTITDTGLDKFPGVYVHEPKRNTTSRRKGINMNSKTKLTACLKFKSMVETFRIKLNSKELIAELKNFVRSGQSFSARFGNKDDLVMATIQCIHILLILSRSDPEFSDSMREIIEDDEGEIEPLPFLFLI